MIQNLNQIALDCQRRFKEEFSNDEFVLSKEFKEVFGTYLRKRNQNIDFSSYTAVVTTSGNNKIFMPNQWFAAAAYMAPFVEEFLEYQSLVMQILEEGNPADSNLKDYITTLKRSSDDEDQYEFREFAEKELKGIIPDEEINETAEYLSYFVFDYDWWFGSKTIDRGDAYYSPVLALLEVVNVTQEYIADISHAFATEPLLAALADQMIEKFTKQAPEGEDRTPIKELPKLRLTGGTNEIVYGAPGTGKSRYLEDKYGIPPYTIRVVFHPEYSYFDFIGTYKPVPVYRDTGNEYKSLDGSVVGTGEPHIDYRFVPGPFINILINAWRYPEHMWTILIEEINRANAAAVFGETFQLLDRTIDGSSEYTLAPPEDLRNYLLSVDGMSSHLTDGLKLPSNLNIVATMNSADQGVKPMDSAFKRRWNFKYLRISIIGAVHEKAVLRYADRYVYWGRLVEAINRKLSGVGIALNEDRLIGPYFVKPEEVGTKSATDKLLLYLWDDVLRHNRDSFFNSEIRTFSDLSDKFEFDDVLAILGESYSSEIEAQVPGTTEEDSDEEEKEETMSLEEKD
ncbi:AAA family ATPase [bacterium]|nr:AAA family ATPase [bacterium]